MMAGNADLSERIKTSFRNIRLESLLEQYEQHALDILEHHGYRVRSWSELMDALDGNAEVPEPVANARSVLLRANTVKYHINSNRAESAAWNAILLVRAAMRAGMPEIEELLEKERQSDTGKRKKGKEGPLKSLVRELLENGASNLKEVLKGMRALMSDDYRDEDISDRYAGMILEVTPEGVSYAYTRSDGTRCERTVKRERIRDIVIELKSAFHIAKNYK
jgi:hypothetical protein